MNIKEFFKRNNLDEMQKQTLLKIESRGFWVLWVLLLAALIAGRAKLCSAAILAGICGFPACVFFALGALGMVCMCVFARRLDSSDPRANWLEQGVNALAQICIYIGLLLV